MSPAARILPALLVLLALAPAARADDPVARLPEGAQVVAFFDLAAWRASGAMKTLDAEKLGQQFGFGASLLEGLGAEGRFDRMAFGGFPAKGGQEMKLAMIVDGHWDRSLMTKALLEDGAVEIAVGGRPAYRMPKDENGDDFVVSFLEEGRLAVSDWDLAETVQAGGGPLSPSLASEVAALPGQLSAWLLVADPMKAGASSGVDTTAAAGFAGGLRSLGLWARAAAELEVGATALARDAQQATQLGAMLQLGLLGLNSQAETEWTALLSTLRFDSKGERLNLALKLGPEQVARIAREFATEALEAPSR